jgi:hypothetical protein
MEVKSMAGYIADSETELYHKENCTELDSIEMEKRIYLRDVEEAENSGYEPCPVCIPPDIE